MELSIVTWQWNGCLPARKGCSNARTDPSQQRDLDGLLKIVLAHARIKHRTQLVISLLKRAPTLLQRIMGGPIGWADDHSPVSDGFRASIEQLSNLRGTDYGELALTASNFCSKSACLPVTNVFPSSRVSVRRDWTGPRMGNNRGRRPQESHRISPFLIDLLSLFVDSDADVADAALEVYTKRVYRAHNVISTDIIRVDGLDHEFQIPVQHTQKSLLSVSVLWSSLTLETAKLQMAILDRLASHIGDESKDTRLCAA